MQEFRAAKARLSGEVDGIKLAGFPGTQATDTWQEMKDWAAQQGKSAGTIDAILQEWQQDPELRQILKETGFDLVSTGLMKLLVPWLESPLDLGKFVVNYGYDATAWTASRNRILQQYNLRDQDLKAVNALKQQTERTVASLKECRAR